MNDTLRREFQELALDIELWLSHPDRAQDPALALARFDSGIGLIHRISQMLEKLQCQKS